MQACMAQPVPDVASQPAAMPAAAPEPDATQRTVQPVVPSRARVQPVPAVGPTQRQVTSIPAAHTPLPSRTEPSTNGQQIFCSNCGRANKPSARFCATCGASLPAYSAPEPARQQPAPQQPLPQPVRPVADQPPVATLPPARFVVTTPRGAWEYPLLTLPVRIGRRDPSQNHYPELDLADYDRGHASRRHAVIERRGDQYVLTDVGSVNGTLLNRMPLPPHRPNGSRGFAADARTSSRRAPAPVR